MQAMRAGLLMSWALLVPAIGTTHAAVKDRGEYEYRNSCALCHGIDGKGQGAIMDLLRAPPPDLTRMSSRNGGVFPSDRVHAVIDGREAVKAHGTRDMPAWGDRYAAASEGAKAAEYYGDTPYDMEMYARARITALVDYLNRIQRK